MDEYRRMEKYECLRKGFGTQYMTARDWRATGYKKKAFSASSK